MRFFFNSVKVFYSIWCDTTRGMKTVGAGGEGFAGEATNYSFPKWRKTELNAEIKREKPELEPGNYHWASGIQKSGGADERKRWKKETDPQVSVDGQITQSEQFPCGARLVFVTPRGLPWHLISWCQVKEIYPRWCILFISKHDAKQTFKRLKRMDD